MENKAMTNKSIAARCFKGILIVLLACSGVQNSSAQVIGSSGGQFTKVGLAGAQFLKIGVGARSTGLAGAFSGFSDDVTSLYWNPAGIADISSVATNVSTTFWLAGMTHQFAGVVLPISHTYKLGVSFVSFNSGDIPVTTLARPDGTGGFYNVADLAIGLTFSGYLTEQFAFGVTAKYVQLAFADMGAGGFIFDIGTRYKTGYRGLLVGFSINSLGPRQTYSGAALNETHKSNPAYPISAVDMQVLTSPFELPLSFRAGLGVDVFNGLLDTKPAVDEDGTVVSKLMLGVDFETLSDVPEQFSLGAEYTYYELLTLRAGYRMGQDQFGLGGGVGLNYTGGGFRGTLDFSVNPTVNLGLVNRLSISLQFD